jgi:hypothetical protein
MLPDWGVCRTNQRNISTPLIQKMEQQLRETLNQFFICNDQNKKKELGTI